MKNSNNKNNPILRYWPLLLLLGIPALTLLAQGYNQDLLLEGDDGGTIYVNTKAPGVHKEYDSKYGGLVWKNGMGGYICRDVNMAPIEDIDKNVFFDGDENNSWVHKEWDPNRNCYIWKDNTGNFLGRDKPDTKDVDDWLDKKDKDWMENGNEPKGKESETAALTREQIKKNLKKLEIAQYEAQDRRDYQENEVDRNMRGGGASGGGGDSDSGGDSDDGGGGSIRDIPYEDVDYADIERLLNDLDKQVASMTKELASAKKKLYENGYTEYSTLIGNCQSTINHYKQKRQSTRDLAKMVRYADASVEEMDQQLSIVYQALVDAGTSKRYGSTISKMRQGLNKYRTNRKKIRFWDD